MILEFGQQTLKYMVIYGHEYYSYPLVESGGKYAIVQQSVPSSTGFYGDWEIDYMGQDRLYGSVSEMQGDNRM